MAAKSRNTFEEKARLVSHLKAARDRKRKATGKCGGRKSYAESVPETMAMTIGNMRRKTLPRSAVPVILFILSVIVIGLAFYLSRWLTAPFWLAYRDGGAAPRTWPPMDLAKMRRQGVPHLIAFCHNDACRHQAVIDVSSYPPETPVPWFRSRVKCGSKRVDVRPNSKEKRGMPTKLRFD